VEKAIGDSIGAILNQGVLGAICILLLYAVNKLYQEREVLRREKEALYERHIAKAENFAEKQTQLADRVTAILESAQRKGG
jgi:hypothetical protein